MNSVHLDSSSISVEVEYKNRESENQEVEEESSATSEEMKAIKLAAMAGMKWITRVPLSIKEAKNKLEDIEENDWEESKINGYKIAETSSDYGG